MPVTLIGNSTSASTGAAPTGNSTVSQADFLKLMLTQIQYQDPLKPMDNQAFLAQMAQFSSLQQTQQLNSQLGNLLSIQTSMQSIGLIGKTVQISSPTGTQIGTITTLTFDQNGTPTFSIQTATAGTLTNISLSQISVVR